jgi:O-acetyl-ADP-ribose deacetylase (regulator of RNase III)
VAEIEPAPVQPIELIQADITTLAVDAIVNAANSALAPGGGVDGAIRRVAGPKLTEATRRIGFCPTGEARLTGGYDLAAKHVIHTVGPVWHGGDQGEDELLAACYRNSLIIAADHDLTSIAFPAISTGIYGFPRDRAAKIAITAVRDFLRAHNRPARIILVARDADDLAVLLRARTDQNRPQDP